MIRGMNGYQWCCGVTLLLMSVILFMDVVIMRLFVCWGSKKLKCGKVLYLMFIINIFLLYLYLIWIYILVSLMKLNPLLFSLQTSAVCLMHITFQTWSSIHWWLKWRPFLRCKFTRLSMIKIEIYTVEFMMPYYSILFCFNCYVKVAEGRTCNGNCRV